MAKTVRGSKSFKTCRFSSKMCMRSEYNDHFKPYNVKANTTYKKKEYNLCNFPFQGQSENHVLCLINFLMYIRDLLQGMAQQLLLSINSLIKVRLFLG